MLKQIAWNTFKNTGNINTMMELIEVEKVTKNVQMKNDDKKYYFVSKINDNKSGNR